MFDEGNEIVSIDQGRVEALDHAFADAFQLEPGQIPRGGLYPGTCARLFAGEAGITAPLFRPIF